MNNTAQLYESAIGLLKQLIATPSFSKEEAETATIIGNFLQSNQIPFNRHLNNIWAVNKYFDEAKPTILLNSHHDTVKPSKGYTVDPFEPTEQEGKLYGLGSNDAGGCLVSIIACFLHFYPQQNLSHNILLAASAEEEISGKLGIESLMPIIPDCSFGIVGEPTLLNLAVAEKGLLVLDAEVLGKAGHAARNEGDNALYKAVHDIEWLQNYRFEKVSDLLGPVKLTVTSFNTENIQHNVVPAQATYLIDVRVNELYTFDAIITTIQQHINAVITPRSTRLKSTAIALDHPLVKAGVALGKNCYGSPTTSDKALMPFPTLKAGPGDSARSHTANEFIYLEEIRQGINFYIQLINGVL